MVDGLKLLERADGHGDPGDGRRSEGPRAGGLALHHATGTRRRPDEQKAVLAAIAELQRTHDAVADLLLAESVHQVVSGNPAAGGGRHGRAGGRRVRAAAARGGEDPADRRSRSSIGWRSSSRRRCRRRWPAGRPTRRGRWPSRGLEAWAQGALGDPEAIPLAVGDPRTLADASLSALDVLYDADGDSVGHQHPGRAAPAGPARPRRGPVTAGLDLGDRRSAARPAGVRPPTGRGRRRTPGRGPAGREAADRPAARRATSCSARAAAARAALADAAGPADPAAAARLRGPPPADRCRSSCPPTSRTWPARP